MNRIRISLLKFSIINILIAAISTKTFSLELKNKKPEYKYK